MENLPRTKEIAKQLFLQRQAKQILAGLETADASERTATIRHIDGFLGAVSSDGKIFWLKIREKLERLNERFQS